MRAKFRCSTLVTCVLFILPLALIACGDDDESEVNPATAQDAGQAGAAGNAGAAGKGSAAPSMPLPAKTAGKACTADGDCAPGTCASMLKFLPGASDMVAPGGHCTGTCTKDEHCGEGGTCRGSYSALDGSGVVDGRCLAACSGDSECRMGYRCRSPLGQALPDGGMPATMGTASFAGRPTCQPSPSAP